MVVQSESCTSVPWDPVHDQEYGANSLHPALAPHVYGHQQCLESIRTAWSTGRRHHALLLTGPKGIGKATLAYSLAKSLLSPEENGGREETGEAWDQSSGIMSGLEHTPQIRRFLAGSHTGFFPIMRSIDPKSKKIRTEIGVSDIRKLAHFLQHTPPEGSWRVSIIDSVDDLNRNAANALLKILEEPPVRTLLFLISHRSGLLLPTVVSRCQRYSLRPLTQDQMSAVLVQNRIRSSDIIPLITALSAGSPGHAVHLVQPQIVDILTQGMALLQQGATLDIQKAHQFSMQACRTEHTFFAFKTLILWWIHRLIRFYYDRSDGTEIFDGEYRLYAHICSVVSVDRWLTFQEKNSQLFGKVDRLNLDRKQSVLSVLTEISHIIPQGYKA